MRRSAFILFSGLLVIAPLASSQERTQNSDYSKLSVILLGTRSGPAIDPQRAGIGTLVVAGSEQLLFDCGRGIPTAMSRMAIVPADVTKVFLTHLHSDHVISCPSCICIRGPLKVGRRPLKCGDRMAPGR